MTNNSQSKLSSRTWGLVLLACLSLTLVGCGSSDVLESTTTSAAKTISSTPAAATTSLPSAGQAAPTDVMESAWAAWAHDVEGFRELVSDGAIWFGQSLETEPGRTSYELALSRATALGFRFTDVECIDTGETDSATEGAIVRCEGMYSDERFEAFETPPQRAIGEYAVVDGQIVNAISYDGTPAPWFAFIVEYLATNYPDEMFANCDGPDATGETCGSYQLQNAKEVAAAWSAQEEG